MADVHDLGDAGEALRHQEAAAADRDQRLLARVGLHSVDAFLDARVHARQRRLDEPPERSATRPRSPRSIRPAATATSWR
jgi:hypothetical protein